MGSELTAHPQLVPVRRGVPHTRRLFHTVPINDANRLEERLLRKPTATSIGAFLIEPIMGNCCAISATREFLRDTRELCDRYGILLIIDEVKTGFRVARGGVQELFGVKADLCTFAKAMANGYPIPCAAARGHHAQVRRRRDPWRHLHLPFGSLAAAEKTLEILAETRCAARRRGLWLEAAKGHEPASWLNAALRTASRVTLH